MPALRDDLDTATSNRRINLDFSSSDEDDNDDDNEEEELSDGDRRIIESMKELSDHEWEPVDSLVVSLQEPTVSAVKKKSSQPKSKREVVFATVEIRTYGMTLGDNPSCSYGPPVSLDWEYDELMAKDLDEYEDSRKRRTMRQMVLSYYQRCDILEQAGYTRGELKSATRQIGKTKRQREATKFFAPVMGVESMVRSAGRKVKRVVAGKA